MKRATVSQSVSQSVRGAPSQSHTNKSAAQEGRMDGRKARKALKGAERKRERERPEKGEGRGGSAVDKRFERRRERVFIENIPTIDSFIYSLFGSGRAAISGARIKHRSLKIGKGIVFKDSVASASGKAGKKLGILCFSPLFEPPPKNGGGGRTA